MYVVYVQKFTYGKNICYTCSYYGNYLMFQDAPSHICISFYTGTWYLVPSQLSLAYEFLRMGLLIAGKIQDYMWVYRYLYIIAVISMILTITSRESCKVL